ncbi:MAG: hypothetical protein ACOCRX_08450 [Candidatus Woesearchaeota archaeon]
MLLKKPPLIIDNCVLGNLLSANQLNLLHELYPGDIIIPTHVLEESSLKRELYNKIEPLEEEGLFETYTIDSLKHIRKFALLERRFKDNGEKEAKGEAAVLTIADILNGTVCSDNISDVINFVENHDNIELMTTLGILYDAYNEKLITFEKSEMILSKILSDGNKMPVEQFEQVVDWFENGKGKKLY